MIFVVCPLFCLLAVCDYDYRGNTYPGCCYIIDRLECLNNIYIYDYISDFFNTHVW